MVIAKTCSGSPLPPPPPAPTTEDEDETCKWVQVSQTDGKRPYWYNTATLESRWTKPTKRKRVPGPPPSVEERQRAAAAKRAKVAAEKKEKAKRKLERKEQVRKRAAAAGRLKGKRRKQRARRVLTAEPVPEGEVQNESLVPAVLVPVPVPVPVDEVSDTLSEAFASSDEASAGGRPAPARARRNAAQFPTVWWAASVNGGTGSPSIKEATM